VIAKDVRTHANQPKCAMSHVPDMELPDFKIHSGYFNLSWPHLPLQLACYFTAAFYSPLYYQYGPRNRQKQPQEGTWTLSGCNSGHDQHMPNLLYRRFPTSSMRIHLSLLPSTAQKDTHGLPPMTLHLLRPLRSRAQIHPLTLLKRLRRRPKHRQTWL
jgi:hypothetical protein